MTQTANVLDVFYLLNADPFSLLYTLLLLNRLSCNSASGWVQPMGMLRQKIKRKRTRPGYYSFNSLLGKSPAHGCVPQKKVIGCLKAACPTLILLAFNTSLSPIPSSLRVITPLLFLALGFTTLVDLLYPTRKFRISPHQISCVFVIYFFLGTLSDSATLLLTIPKN